MKNTWEITCSRCNQTVTAYKKEIKYRKNGRMAFTRYTDANKKVFYNNICYLCHLKKLHEKLKVKAQISKERRQREAAIRKQYLETRTKRFCSRCKFNRDIQFIKVYRTKTRVNGQSSKDFDIKTGKIWISGHCPECQKEKEDLARGYTNRQESTRPQTMAAVAAENKAMDFFKSLGFEIKEVTKVNGPDFICSLGPWTYTVEVKRATYSGRSWHVGKVRPKRESDDLIAFVLPNGRVYIDDMKIHLTKCTKEKSRSITDIVRAYGLVDKSS